MLPPSPTEPGADAYLTVTAQGATLRQPTRDYLVQAAAVAVLLPVLVVLVFALFGLMLDLRGRAVDVLGGLTCLLSGMTLALGLGLAALAPLRSGWSRVELSVDGGSVRLPRGRRLEPGQVTRIRAGHLSPLFKWRGIVAETSAGDVVIVRGLPPGRARAWGAVARWLGEAWQVPVQAEDPASLALGMGPREQAMACYLPLQGIWILASILVLIFSKDAFARFAARQSLVFFAISSVVLVVMVVCGAGIGIGLEQVHRGLGVIPMLLFILPPVLIRLGLMLAALFQARRGRAWIIPGMGFLVRRWQPPEESWPLRS